MAASEKEDEHVRYVLTMKREKAKLKTNFTRARRKLISLMEGNASKSEVQAASNNFDAVLDEIIENIDILSNAYMQGDEIENSIGMIAEMEKIKDEYSRTIEALREYLEDIRSDRGSITRENDTINKAVSGVSVSENISQCSYDQNQNIRNPWAKFGTQQYQSQKNRPYLYDKHEQIGFSHLRQGATTCNVAPTIEQDLWRHLKRVEIPVFSGEKKFYHSWKAAFVACIDNAPATSEYKLLQLRQYLAGEALHVIENLGHSAAAYEAAKSRLERKYGGRRRQVALYLEELEQFRQVRYGQAGDLDKFADLLDIAIINLQEAGQFNELGSGSLLTKLQRKLPETLLAQYHRWAFESREDESVMSLRTWAIQEAEFQTMAAETINGLTGNVVTESSSRPSSRYRNQRTFFGDARDSRGYTGLQCRVCHSQHEVWNCLEFKEQSVPIRWNIAKRLQLCFRCLGEGHVGRFCPGSRECGQNGCYEHHHKLLHMSPRNTEQSTSAEPRTYSSHLTIGSPVSSSTEGKKQATFISENQLKSDIISFRTVPVILTNGNRSITVNALLDDASSKTYINGDVAAALGCIGRTEKVTINVLNGQLDTFETRSAEFVINSVAGDVSMKVSAYTANKVTGNMNAIDWNKHKNQWPHLRGITFPSGTSGPIVDILIGLDSANLHYAIEERRGKKGEPIARLTPLGWTCVGKPWSTPAAMIQTHFAHSYFVNDVFQIETVNKTLQKFLDVDKTAILETPVIKVEESKVDKTVEASCTFEEMYHVSMPRNSKNCLGSTSGSKNRSGSKSRSKSGNKSRNTKRMSKSHKSPASYKRRKSNKKSASKTRKSRSRKMSTAKKMKSRSRKWSAAENMKSRSRKKSATKTRRSRSRKQSAAKKMKSRSRKRSAPKKSRSRKRSAAKKMKSRSRKRSAAKKMKSRSRKRSAAKKMKYRSRKVSASKKMKYRSRKMSAVKMMRYRSRKTTAAKKRNSRSRKMFASKKRKSKSREWSADKKRKFRSRKWSAAMEGKFRSRKWSAVKKGKFRSRKWSAAKEGKFRSRKCTIAKERKFRSRKWSAAKEGKLRSRKWSAAKEGKLRSRNRSAVKKGKFRSRKWSAVKKGKFRSRKWSAAKEGKFRSRKWSAAKEGKFRSRKWSAAKKGKFRSMKTSAFTKKNLTAIKMSAFKKRKLRSMQMSVSRLKKMRSKKRSASKDGKIRSNKRSASKKIELRSRKISCSERGTCRSEKTSASMKGKFKSRKMSGSNIGTLVNMSASKKAKFRSSKKFAFTERNFRSLNMSASKRGKIRSRKTSTSKKRRRRSGKRSASKRGKFRSSKTSAFTNKNLRAMKRRKIRSLKMPASKARKFRSSKIFASNDKINGIKLKREWLLRLHATKRDVTVSKVVIIISPDTSKGLWPLGRILEMFPGPDGRDLVAKIQVGQSTVTRSITRLCQLELGC